MEAESYPGTSLIIAYSPCIAHGVDLSNNLRQQDMAVRSGHWPLLRYDPRRARDGNNPLQLDSQKPSMLFRDYALTEARFSLLSRAHPEDSERFLYQPDVDLDNQQVTSQLQWSRSADSQLSLRWVALLYGQVGLSLATISGVRTADDVLKLILAGADTTQLCSVLLEHGPGYLGTIKSALQDWLVRHEVDALGDLRGRLSKRRCTNPACSSVPII